MRFEIHPGPPWCPSGIADTGLVDAETWRFMGPGKHRIPAGRLLIFCEMGARVWLLDETGTEIPDQHGHRLSKISCLVADQWNVIDAPRARWIAADAGSSGWLQVVPAPPASLTTGLEATSTLRGTHSAFDFSRGNTYPGVTMPHGFVQTTPITDSASTRWLYTWAASHIAGVALTHAPSPWIGDRASCQFLVWSDGDAPLPLSHDNESARVDRYECSTADGSHITITPTMHGAELTFRFSSPDTGVRLTSNGPADVRLESLPDGRIAASWWSHDVSDEKGAKPGAWSYAESSGPARILSDDVVVADGELCFRIAQSNIGIVQARHTFALEFGARSSDDLKDLAREAWEQILGRVTITGGRPDQRATAYSDIARLFSWPQAYHENLGTCTEPRWGYASPFTDGPETSEGSGRPIVTGALAVNHGFWDTYRTAWPAFFLFAPRHARGLLDDIVAAFRTSGWMSRWAAPGHRDAMVGTSSDAVCADADAHGITCPDAYESALKDALVPSGSPHVGRKGLARGRFVGWIDRTVHEGFSWSVENANCDAALAAWSARLAARDPNPEYAANAAYFANRALAWRDLFVAGFLRGRDADGSRGGVLDPLRWGEDYTETTAWGMAFSVPWDGAGLVAAHGGEEALAARLDEAFATPEAADGNCPYGYTIHEMYEARALGWGQVAVTNQPAHHTPFMYTHAGRHDRTQELAWRVGDLLTVGTEIGQGYLGDEDNGEMAAFQLLCLVGLYPLHVGSGEFIITAPAFDEFAWRRDDGTTIRVRGRGAGPYVDAVRINGEEWEQVTVDTATLHRDCLIEIDRSPMPSGWAHDSRPASLSKPASGETLSWQPDRARRCSEPTLIDDEGTTPVEAGGGVVAECDGFAVGGCAALTFDQVPTPGSWRLEAHTRSGWVECRTVEPRWANQTTPQPLPADPLDAVRISGAAVLRQIEIF